MATLLFNGAFATALPHKPVDIETTTDVPQPESHPVVNVPKKVYVPPAPAYQPPVVNIPKPVYQPPVVDIPKPVYQPPVVDIPKPVVQAPVVQAPVIPAAVVPAAVVPAAAIPKPVIPKLDVPKPDFQAPAIASLPKPVIGSAVAPNIQSPAAVVPDLKLPVMPAVVLPDVSRPVLPTIQKPTIPDFQLAVAPDITTPTLPAFHLPTVFAGPITGPNTESPQVESREHSARAPEAVLTGDLQWITKCWNGTTITLTNSCLQAVVAHASWFDGCNYNFWVDNVGWIHTTSNACALPPQVLWAIQGVIWGGCGCSQFTFISPSGLWCTGYYRDNVLIYTGYYPRWVRTQDQALQAQSAGQLVMDTPDVQSVIGTSAIVTDVPNIANVANVVPLAPTVTQVPFVTAAVEAVSQAMSPLILPVSNNRSNNWWQGPALALGIGLLVAAWFADRRKIELENKFPQPAPGSPTHIAGRFA